MTLLRPRRPLDLPVEAEVLVPERFRGVDRASAMRFPVAWGRRTLPLGELFEIDVEEGGEALILEGDFSRVKKIGRGMKEGLLVVRGDAGMHLGSALSGGTIRVEGDVDAWAGAMMSGGTLEIGGSAGPHLAGAYPGEGRGMTGGVVLLRGDASLRAGERMRRGLVAVGGKTGDFTALAALAGTVVVFGRLGIRAGAGSKRGTVVALGGMEGDVLPTYRRGALYRPLFLLPLLRFLAERGFPVTEAHRIGTYRRWTGDVTGLGKGELLVHEQSQ